MDQVGAVVEKTNTNAVAFEGSPEVPMSQERRTAVGAKAGVAARRAAQFIEAFDGITSTLGPVRQTGVKNQFAYPQEPAFPTPRQATDDDPLAWQKGALCAQTDPEAFFPEKGGSTRDAKKVCTSCDVKDECLDYALDNDERFGIWGGLSERERRKLKNRQNAA